MFRKGLKRKKAQYATCFIVCLLCFAFGLIVKPSEKQHPMLRYSMGFLILHFHLNLSGVTFEFETTENNELIYTVKKKGFINDNETEIVEDFRESDETRSNLSIDFESVGGSAEKEDLCWFNGGKILKCSRNELSIKENLTSLFHADPNSQIHFDISGTYRWDVSLTVINDNSLITEVIQRVFSRVVEFVFELQRTKAMLMVYVHDHRFYGPLRDYSNLPEILKSCLFKKRIRNLSLKLMPTSEGLLTEVAYSGLLMPYYMGQIAGAFLLAILVNFIGRKNILITISLTLVLCKLLLLIPERFNSMYVQKELIGFGLAGFYIIVPTYACEIAEDKSRGALFSFLNLFLFLGRLRLFFVDRVSVYHYLKSGLSYIDYLDAVSIALSVIFLVASPWLIESPPYLLLKNKTDEAKKALVKLGRNADDSELENSTDSMVSNGTNGWLKNLNSNFVTVKGLTICCVLIFIQFLSFNNFKENFSRGVLKEYNSVLNAYNIFCIEISLQLTALIFVIVLIDRAGRRFLLLASCTGMTFCSFNLLFMYFAFSFSNDNSELLEWMYWIPVVYWAGFHFSFHLGIGSIPWIVFAEILNTRARGPAMAFMILITVAFSLILHFNLIPLEDDYLPAIQGVNGALGALFVYFYVPETKQKSLEVILEELKK